MEVAPILHAVAWPLVALVAIWQFGGATRRFFWQLSDRLDRAASIKLKVPGLGAIELAGLIAKGSVVASSDAAPVSFQVSEPGETPQQEFDRLLAAYVAVDDADQSQRVVKRDRLANHLAELAKRLNIARSALASGPDEKVAVLATMIIADPRSRDLANLETASKGVKFKFSGYRLVLALLAFLSTYQASSRSLRKAVDILDEIERRVDAGADDDLTAIIGHARRLIEVAAA